MSFNELMHSLEQLTSYHRGMDCGMLSIFNAMEREEDEWREMFAAADSRFVWKGVTQPKGSILALIEAVWEPGHLQNGDAH